MAEVPGNTGSRVVLPIGREVAGVHERDGDADWYRVRLEGGTNYAFRAEVGSDPADSEYAFADLTLRDAGGRILARSGSDDYDGYVGGFDYRPSADGTFFFEVRADAGDRHEVAFEVDEPAGPPTPASIRPGQTREGDFFFKDDADTWSIRLEQGQAYDFAILERDFAYSPQLEVLDGGGRVLAQSRRLEGESPSSSFGDPGQNVEDFRAPYTGIFHLRAVSDGNDNPTAYTIAAELDRGVAPFDPGAAPTGADDLLVGSLTAVDRINALGGDDVVYGRGGNDDLQGGDGSDAVTGGNGRDFVFGGRGDDFLYGDAGDDKLGGGLGRDLLEGGAGRDVFDMAGAGGDRITDFVRGETIDLGRIDAKATRAGDQAFTFVGTREPSAAGQLGYEYVEGLDATFVRGETGGLSDFSVRLDGRVTLAAGDFAL